MLDRACGERSAAGARGRRPAARAEVRDGRVVVPLHGLSAWQGVLSLAPRTDAGADPLDLEVLTAVGQQAGLALERAQLYEQSASVAHELQRSLLAIDLPDDPRFAVATTYRPGVEMLEVGGDWYDVFLAAEGVLSVSVGDVVGRGLGAASAMGQLRSAVRAVPDRTPGPDRCSHGWTASSSTSRPPGWRRWPTPSWTWRPASSAMPAPGTHPAADPPGG